MQSFLELAQKRQSDRAYDQRPVETEKIDQLLEAARLAPSACNAQPWKLIVVTDQEKRLKIADATSSKILAMNHFTKQAPVQIVVVEENANFTSTFGGWTKNKHYPHLDLGILASYVCLAAADLGLGSCMIGWFDEKKVGEVLEIPRNKRVMLIITIGYSAQNNRIKKRKNTSDIISFDKY